MTHFFRPHRPEEKEARLCRMSPMSGPNVPPSVPPSVPPPVNVQKTWLDRMGDNGKYLLKKLSEGASWLTGDALEQVGKMIAGIPEGISQGIAKAWETLPSRDEVMTYLSRVSGFFNEMKDISIYFPKANTYIDIKTVTNLTDHTQWIETFRENPSLLTNPNVSILPTNVSFGPFELLASLRLEERKAIYMQYVDTFIPAEVQETIGGPGWMNKNPLDRYDIIRQGGNMPKVNAALGGILGLEGWDANLTNITDKQEAKNLAQNSIKSYYRISKDNPNYVSEGLQSDYMQTVRLQPLGGLDVFATDPDKLINGIGPSRFRGALMTGVLDRSKLEIVAGGLKELEHKIRLSRANVRSHLSYYAESNEREFTKEAETLRDTWDGLGGIEKLVLAGAITFGLWKSTFVRTIAMGGVGAYFFQKFVMKHDDPVKKWSELLGGISGKVKDVNARAFGSEVTPGYVEDTATRSNKIIDFLDDYSRFHLERQSIGFGILHDLPMGELAKRFTMDDTQPAHLDLKDPVLHGLIEAALEKRGWSQERYKEFFADPKNCEQVSEALSYVFFVKANEKRENKTKIEFVMDTLRKFPPGTSLSVFGEAARDFENTIPNVQLRMEFQRAHEIYVRLTNEGSEMAYGSTQTLGQFLSQGPTLMPVSNRVGPALAFATGISTAPNIPQSGTKAPTIPASGSSAPSVPNSGTNAPTIPNSGSSAPSVPSSGTKAPDIPTK
jgi:hypothetical protein